MNAALNQIHAATVALERATDMARTPGISSNSDDTLSTTARMRVMCEMEHEPDLDLAKEVPLCDMTEAELCAVILHDEDKGERRKALHLLKQSLLLEAQNRTFNMLGEMQKERRK